MEFIASPMAVLWLAALYDLLLGDPPGRLHPVAWCGTVIGTFRDYAPKHGRALPFFAGVAFVVGGTFAVAAAGWGLQQAICRLDFPLSILAEAAALKMAFSARGLVSAGLAVRRALAAHDLSEARRLVSWHLVSRQTSELDEPRLAAATIESLAENTSDSIIAPLFFYAIAGLPGAWAYRFLNTCDAMLGYRDVEREWLGKAAARLDDVANLIPARLTAILFLLLSPLAGGRLGTAFRVSREDAGKTSSPNAGHPMSAAAGALEVELEKVGHYRLGAGQRLPGTREIGGMVRLLWGAALAMLIIQSSLFLLLN